MLKIYDATDTPEIHVTTESRIFKQDVNIVLDIVCQIPV